MLTLPWASSFSPFRVLIGLVVNRRITLLPGVKNPTAAYYVGLTVHCKLARRTAARQWEFHSLFIIVVIPGRRGPAEKSINRHAANLRCEPYRFPEYLPRCVDSSAGRRYSETGRRYVAARGSSNSPRPRRFARDPGRQLGERPSRGRPSPRSRPARSYSAARASPPR